ARAGRFRTIRIAKEQSVFCYPENIASEMRRVFADLRATRFLRGLSADDFAISTARVLSEVNAIHPFREGNGRAQFAFMALLGVGAGHPLDFERLERERYLSAIKESFRGD